MPASKIVLTTMPYDQGDVLEDFLDWHIDLGVDLILAVDGGSTDGSRDILDRYSRSRPVEWFPLPERNLTKYLPADHMAAIARDRHHADWIVYCDVDEFLCTKGDDLRTVLGQADEQGVTMLTIPRRTMTGPLLRPGERATEALTLRIDRTVEPTAQEQVSWNLPAPLVFLEVGGHVAVRASAFDTYGAGVHVATTTWGTSVTSDALYILHYAIRDFESLETKVANAAAWLADNPHLALGWGWHWRRWIRLHEEGRLRDDYERQFVTSDRARQLLADGTCAVDSTITDWLASKPRSRRAQEVRQ